MSNTKYETPYCSIDLNSNVCSKYILKKVVNYKNITKSDYDKFNNCQKAFVKQSKKCYARGTPVYHAIICSNEVAKKKL